MRQRIKPRYRQTRELRRLIGSIRDEFDYIVVDTKGEAATTTDQALLLADPMIALFRELLQPLDHEPKRRTANA